MTEATYKKLEADLIANGYRKSLPGAYSEGESLTYSKSIRDDEGEPLYHIWWLVYDRVPYFHLDPMLKKNPIGVEVKIYICHAVELHLWEREYTIGEVERAAAELYKFATTNHLNKDTQR